MDDRRDSDESEVVESEDFRATVIMRNSDSRIGPRDSRDGLVGQEMRPAKTRTVEGSAI